MLHGDIGLRHSGFRSRKRGNARRPRRSLTTTCSPRKHPLVQAPLPPSTLHVPHIVHPAADRPSTLSRRRSTSTLDDLFFRQATCRAAERTGGRMRRTAATSGPHALSICASFVVVMVLASVTDQVHAKRGCSAFGHSCFGGHGKRFDPQFQESLQQLENPKPIANEKIEDYVDPDLILVDQNRGVQGREERSFTGAPRRDSQRLDPYTLSLLVGQWLASHRRPHRAELEVNSK